MRLQGLGSAQLRFGASRSLGRSHQYLVDTCTCKWQTNGNGSKSTYCIYAPLALRGERERERERERVRERAQRLCFLCTDAHFRRHFTAAAAKPVQEEVCMPVGVAVEGVVEVRAATAAVAQ